MPLSPNQNCSIYLQFLFLRQLHNWYVPHIFSACNLMNLDSSYTFEMIAMKWLLWTNMRLLDRHCYRGLKLLLGVPASCVGVLGWVLVLPPTQLSANAPQETANDGLSAWDVAIHMGNCVMVSITKKNTFLASQCKCLGTQLCRWFS